MRFNTKRKIAAGLGIVASGLMATGIAYASWSGSNTAAGAKGKGNSISFSVVGVTPTTGDAYPGAGGALEFTVTNNKPFSISVSSLDVSAAVLTTDVAACNSASGSGKPTLTGAASPITVTGTMAQDASNTTTIAGSGSKTFLVGSAYTWAASTGTDNNCQGAGIVTTDATVNVSAF